MKTRRGYGPEHEAVREVARKFAETRIVPHHEEWEAAGGVDPSLFTEAGELGLLGFPVAEAHGGPGVEDFRYHAILVDEIARTGSAAEAICFSLQNDVVLPYLTELGTEEQKSRYLPGVVSGHSILGIALTEPGTGSDLAGIATTAVRDGDHYVVNGAKTFISNGQNGTLFVVAVRTGKERHTGLSLLLVEADTPGFARGRNLDKIGLHAQDTSELSFTDMRVPVENLIGDEGEGFAHLIRNLPQERLSLAVGAVAAAEGTFDATVAYVRERKAFGATVSSFQNTKFVLAELDTELDMARCYLEDCIAEHVEGRLTAARAARLKLASTELQMRVADRCLQLHGGYGYMREYPVSRAFVDARIQSIYGGTSEVMKTIIAKDIDI